MRKEHTVGGGMKQKSDPKGSHKKGGGLAIGTQGWVNDKIESGDIEGGMSSNQSGTSIFDPVLAEIAYRWFCLKGGTVLDPFAGGSVRGIVASLLGLKYVGIELRAEQVAGNREQIKIAGKIKPEWREGDSRDIARLAADVDADLIFSCPPFWNLEVYSDDPKDISTLGAEDFFAAQQAIIVAAVSRLRNHRFAVWVTSDVRDKAGLYVNVPGRTVQAFEAAGMRLYNEAILVTAVGSLPVRVNKQFKSARKLGRTHQIVQIYVKGDPRKATQACGEVEFGEVPTETAAPSADTGNIGAKFGTPL